MNKLLKVLLMVPCVIALIFAIAFAGAKKEQDIQKPEEKAKVADVEKETGEPKYGGTLTYGYVSKMERLGYFKSEKV